MTTHVTRRIGRFWGAMIVLLACPEFGAAQTGGGFDLTWNTINAGAVSTGGTFTLTGTTGQHDALISTGGGFSLIGGFWYGGSAPTEGIADPELPGAPPAAVAFQVSQAVPNPFNPRTSVVVEVGEQSRVRAEVVDMAGRVVRTLLDQELTPGRHDLTWDGQDDSNHSLASGVYFLHVMKKGHAQSQKLVLVK